MKYLPIINLSVLNEWKNELKCTILHYLKNKNPNKIRHFYNIDSTGRQEVTSSTLVFSTNNTKPYSNVRLFLWTLGGDLEWSFVGLSVKMKLDLSVLSCCLFSVMTSCNLFCFIFILFSLSTNIQQRIAPFDYL